MVEENYQPKLCPLYENITKTLYDHVICQQKTIKWNYGRDKRDKRGDHKIADCQEKPSKKV